MTYAAFYALVPTAPYFGLALILVMLAHLGGGAQWTASTYGLQVATPDHLRGRILSIDYGLATLAIGASSIVAGVLADREGAASATYWLAGAAGVYAVAWLSWSAGAMRAR